MRESFDKNFFACNVVGWNQPQGSTENMFLAHSYTCNCWYLQWLASRGIGNLCTCWSYALRRWDCYSVPWVLMCHAFYPSWKWSNKQSAKGACVSDPGIARPNVGRSALPLEAWDQQKPWDSDMGREEHWPKEENFHYSEKALQHWLVYCPVHQYMQLVTRPGGRVMLCFCLLGLILAVLHIFPPGLILAVLLISRMCYWFEQNPLLVKVI